METGIHINTSLPSRTRVRQPLHPTRTRQSSSLRLKISKAYDCLVVTTLRAIFKSRVSRSFIYLYVQSMLVIVHQLIDAIATDNINHSADDAANHMKFHRSHE